MDDMTDHSPREDSTDIDNTEPYLSISVHSRQPNCSELIRVNDIISSAMQTWKLSERVKRISLPLYRYHESDLQHMHFLIAETKTAEIIGVATLEETNTNQHPGDRPIMLVHGLYVCPDHHGRGIGSQLVNSAADLAQAHSAHGLLVRAQPDASHFFEKQGFSRLRVEDEPQSYAHRYWKSIQPAILSPL